MREPLAVVRCPGNDWGMLREPFAVTRCLGNDRRIMRDDGGMMRNDEVIIRE